jgi:SAM-dependent methyltransferase
VVIDLGCGGGEWARMLTDAGYSVLGIDASPAMIGLARRTAPGAEFQVASLFDPTLPLPSGCFAVTALGEPLNYYSNRPRSLAPLFRRVWKALAPGGWFVFDIAQPDPHAGEQRRGYLQGEDWAVLFETHQDPDRPRLERRIVTFRRSGGPAAGNWRRSEELHVQQLYSAPDLARQLRAVGFRATVRRGYGDFRLPGNRAVVIARKPAGG